MMINCFLKKQNKTMIRSEHLKEHYKLLPQEQLSPKIPYILNVIVTI